VAFFKTIRAEISKATEFYLGMEQQMGARKRRIRWVSCLCVWVSACVHRFIQWLTPSPSHSHSHSTAPRQCRLGIQYLKQPTTVLEDDAWTRMRGACVALYKDLLLLEHFAVMNYCGASSRHRHRHPPVTRPSRLFGQAAG